MSPQFIWTLVVKYGPAAKPILVEILKNNAEQIVEILLEVAAQQAKSGK